MNLPDPSSDRRRLALIGLAFWSFAVAIWLALLAPRMAPVRHGTAEDFWEIACGIELAPPNHEWGGRVLYDEGGWVVYDRSHLHGSDAFYVSKEEAAARLDDALVEVEKVRQSGLRSLSVEAVEKWQADGGRASGDLEKLIEDIQEAWRRRHIEKRPDLLPYYVDDEQSLAERWGRMKTYWAAIAFEWLFFTGLAAIALRPWARSLGPLGWGMPFALLPPLFMLPAYLGYSTFTFTSAGRSGGVLYPWLHSYGTIRLHRVIGVRMSEADHWILGHLAQLLEPISAPIGSPMALSGLGMPGPTEAVIFGLVLGGAVGGCRWTLLRRRIGALPSPNPS